MAMILEFAFSCLGQSQCKQSRHEDGHTTDRGWNEPGQLAL